MDKIRENTRFYLEIFGALLLVASLIVNVLQFRQTVDVSRPSIVMSEPSVIWQYHSNAPDEPQVHAVIENTSAQPVDIENIVAVHEQDRWVVADGHSFPERAEAFSTFDVFIPFDCEIFDPDRQPHEHDRPVVMPTRIELSLNVGGGLDTVSKEVQNYDLASIENSCAERNYPRGH